MNQNLKIIFFYMTLLFMILPLSCSRQIVWQNTYGPYKGDVITIVTGAKGLVLAGTKNGIFRSTDKGETWSPVNADFWNTPFSWLNTLGIASNGFIYARTGDGTVYRSSDNGNTWNSLRSLSEDAPVKRIILSANGDIFAMVDSIGILRSTNNGDSWDRINHMLPLSKIHSLAVDSAKTMIIAADTNVYRSTDQGKNWTTINQGLENRPNVFAFNSFGYLFEGGSGGVGIYRSIDNGENWTISYQIKKPHPITKDTIIMPCNIQSIVTGSDGYVFAVKDYYLIRSTDNGESWMNVSLITGKKTLVLSIAVNSDHDVFAGIKSYGIFSSTSNGDDWTSIAPSFTSVNIYSFASNKNGHIFAGTDESIFRSTDQGGNWVDIDQGLPIVRSVRSIAINSCGDIFSGISNVGIYHSTNNGDDWTFLSPSGLYLFLDSVENIYSGKGIENPYAYRSTDSGAHWTRIDTSKVMSPLSYAFNSSGHIFAGSAFGVVYRSTDTCATWTQLLKGLPFYEHVGSSNVNAIVINPLGYIFAATDGGLFRSKNNGDDWEKIDHSLPLSIRSYGKGGQINYYTISQILAMVINSNGHIFIGYDRGVYLSIDDGETWSDFNEGLPRNSNVTALVLDPSGYLYAGTNDGLVFRSIKSTVN